MRGKQLVPVLLCVLGISAGCTSPGKQTADASFHGGAPTVDTADAPPPQKTLARLQPASSTPAPTGQQKNTISGSTGLNAEWRNMRPPRDP